MQKTEYLKLNKPDSTDFFSVDHQNQNMELIDAELEADKKEIENIKAESDKLNSDLSGKANSSHTHTKSEVGLGNVDNTADANKNVKYATSAGSSTKSIGVVDYGSTTKTIQIGYGGDGISGDNIKYIAGYTTGNGDDVDAKIKDVSKDALKSWLGLGSLAYSSATIPTSLPANGGNSSTVNGHTVNSDVPANAKFTDTTYNDATTTSSGLMSASDKTTIENLKNGAVTGIKGNAETEYRTGNVNITAEDIGINVDSALSSTSTNPVQNKVVAAALNGKMPVYSYNGGTFDADDLTSPAIHLINSGGTNLPASCSGGVLLVAGGPQPTQYFFPLYNGDNRIHTRYKYHGTEWTDWEILGLSTSQSTAITTAGTYALDAVQNNASVSGTLANKIKNLSANCPQFISDYKKTLIKNVSAKSYTATEDCMVRCDLVTSGTAFEIMNIKINDIMVYVYQNPTSQASVQSTTSYILKKGDVIKISAVSSTMHVYVKN